jgi:hypothetical protein
MIQLQKICRTPAPSLIPDRGQSAAGHPVQEKAEISSIVSTDSQLHKAVTLLAGRMNISSTVQFKTVLELGGPEH